MAQTNKPDLLLCIAGQEDRTRKWVLDPPQGVDSFRIVVRCRRAQARPSPKPCSWFGHFDAIAQTVLAVFALWRTGYR